MRRSHVKSKPKTTNEDKKTALIAIGAALLTTAAANIAFQKFSVTELNDDSPFDLVIKLPGGKRVKMTKQEFEDFKEANIRNGVEYAPDTNDDTNSDEQSAEDNK